MPTTYDDLIDRVQRPARYAGGELHSIAKAWDGPDAPEVRVALAYPDLYDLGMSNLGLGILYDIVNRREDALAERVFSPWTDFEDLLREHDEPLRSLETRHALHEFDVLGISLSYEVCFTNVLNLLELGGIPIHSADRADDDPIILGGGSAALEPEPMAPFFDAFALGEGEELIDELVDFVRDWKRAGRGSRLELHRALAALDGVYVPSLYEPSYDAEGTLEGTRPVDAAAPDRITRRVVQVLPPPLTKPIVPFMEVVHDRAAIEIQRGCTQGCRFCQAGMIYRPTRERSVEEIVAAAGELLDNTGYTELSLMSLSTTDHRDIVPMVHALMDAYGDRGLRIGLPSTRVDSFSVEVADAVARGKKHTLTLAPEAGSQRLRNTINKLVTEEDLLNAAEHAFSNGWTSIKMYFMVGQPTETDFDIEEVVRIASEVKKIGKRHQGGRARVRVSTSNFIPKAHTPYQWLAQCDADTLRRRHRILREGCKRAGVQFSLGGPREVAPRGGAVARRPPRRRRDRDGVAAGREVRRVVRASRLVDLGARFRGARPRPRRLRVPRPRPLGASAVGPRRLGDDEGVPARRVDAHAERGDHARLQERPLQRVRPPGHQRRVPPQDLRAGLDGPLRRHHEARSHGRGRRARGRAGDVGVGRHPILIIRFVR